MGRDAFAIRLLRRSGEITETGWRFSTRAGVVGCDMLDRLEKLLGLFQNDSLSTRLPYRMAQNQWACFRTGADGLESLEKARRLELQRLTRRHCLDKDNNKG